VRILIVDDEAAVRASYGRIFAPRAALVQHEALASLASELFDDDADEADTATGDNEEITFDIVMASQGLDAVALVEAAVRDGDPFQVAFIDVRMPPGIDGKETARRIRAIDSDINLVIVTGYSDYSAFEIAKVAGPVDKIYYIAKPFEVDEVYQTARALGQRWRVDVSLAAAREELANQVRRLEEQSLQLAANEARAIHIANHDSLTGAPNRLAFLRELNARAQEREGQLAIAMLDIDRFKNINDTLGHIAGDELIRRIYMQLGRVLGNKGVVARLGGDEFGLVFATDSEADAMTRCNELVRACSTSFDVLGHSVMVGASMGLVVSSPEDDRDEVELLRLADLALYDAKRNGRGQAKIFDQSMDESIRFRQQIEEGLREAISRNELELVFQPIVSRDDYKIAGFEALLRWHSPEHGMISPAVFIPIAEESNLIHDLGDWVVVEALKACHSWPGQYVSINFSPRQFRRPNFIEALVAKVDAAGVRPQLVQIEITETAIFDDSDRAARTLEQLREIGFLVALDDFGTGYSSLFNIRNFALDCLKIDKSFIDGMGREVQSAAIVHSITHLARSLGLGIVAEGVETETQNQALRLAGCSHLQGFYFGRPSSTEVTAELATLGVLRPGSGDELNEKLVVRRTA